MDQTGPGRPAQIALVMELADHYDREIVRGILRFARSRPQWQLFGPGWMFSPLNDLPHWRGDGVIARVESPEMAELLNGLHVPVVDVAGAYPGYGFACVRNDDRETGRLVGEYLADRGLRSFAFFGVTDVAWSGLRGEGLAEAAERVLPGARVRNFTRPLAWWKLPVGAKLIDRFIADLPMPTGAMACNDAAALKVLRACRSLEKSVPRDLAVVGVDNEDITCELAQPALSSVDLNLEQIGYDAARILDEALDAAAAGNAAGAPEPLVIPPNRVVERASSRVFATADPLVRHALELIHGQVAAGLSVEDLLREIPLGRRSLEIRFRQETGHTLHQAITDARLRRACDLLRDTDNKVAAVARESGFRSLQRFFDAFKSRFGLTPGQYRDSGSA